MSGAKSRLSVVLATVVLVGFVCTVRVEGGDSSVEKLVNLLPDDVVGFVATSGGDELGPTYNKTILGRMWNDPGVRKFCEDVHREILRKLKEGEGDYRTKAIIEGVDPAGLFLKRPIIAGVARNKVGERRRIYVFAIVDAGPRKAEIASAVGKLEALASEGEIGEVKVGGMQMRGPRRSDEMHGYWGWIGNRFVFAVNDREGLAIKYLKGSSLRMPPPYLGSVKGTGDAFAFYVDTEKVFDSVGAMARRAGEEDDFKLVRTVLSELGLRNVKTMTARVGFSGADVVSHELVRLQGPRAGLLACFGTVDLSMFDMVDPMVLSAGVLNCDVGGVYDTVMRAIRAGSPEDAYPEIQEGITEFEEETGIKIRRGLLASLAGPMVLYSLPAGVMMDAPSGGIVAIAKLKDAGLWREAMASLAKVVAAESDGVVQVSTQVQEGRTFHCWVIAPLAMMQVMPTWTIADNHVVIGSNMGLCNKAVKQMMSGRSGGESLRRTEGFRKATAGVPRNLMGFTYSNSQLQFNQMLMSVQQFWPVITMIAQQADIRLPFMLPQVGHIAKDMGYSSQYCWFDSEGLRSYYRGPGVEPSVAVVAGSAIGASVLMPAMMGTRQVARRTVSRSNLAGIGHACMIYVNEDDEGRFPPNLGKLVELDYISGKQLESPLKPRGFDGPSYMYVAGQNSAAHPGNVVAYDNPAFCSDEINVVFLDGHVDTMKPAEFMRKLEETYKRLGRDMPEIRFKGEEPAVSAVHNLHLLALALKMYLDDNGKLPERLEAVKPYCPDSKVFESPRKPKGFDGPSYIYIQHETENIRGAHYYIVVYENPEFCNDKIPALFLDYSVREMSREEFLRAMEKTYKFLGKEMPEIRFKGGRKGGAVRELR